MRNGDIKKNVCIKEKSKKKLFFCICSKRIYTHAHTHINGYYWNTKKNNNKHCKTELYERNIMIGDPKVKNKKGKQRKNFTPFNPLIFCIESRTLAWERKPAWPIWKERKIHCTISTPKWMFKNTTTNQTNKKNRIYLF